MTDETTIIVDYISRPLEAMMPAYFVKLLVYQVAWHLAEPVTDQVTKAEFWREIALGTSSDNGRGGFFRQAANIDAQGSPPATFETFDLIDVR